MRIQALAVSGVMALVGGCSSPPPKLDGPVDFSSHGLMAGRSMLHIAANGLVTYSGNLEAGPTLTYNGMTSPDALAELSDDIAGANLPSLSGLYVCSTPSCSARLTREIEMESGTFGVQITIEASDDQLPAGLVKVLDDLDAIVNQLTSITTPTQ